METSRALEMVGNMGRVENYLRLSTPGSEFPPYPQLDRVDLSRSDQCRPSESDMPGWTDHKSNIQDGHQKLEPNFNSISSSIVHT